jgi:DNA-directed RNA polymerase subunit omega
MNNSMINPSVVDLVKKAGDRYSVVVITAKRARQIIAGSRPLIDSDITKPLTIAINELDEEKFKFELAKEGIK